jgi:XRE family transcriptional regulator, regulator of sulfur utilization
LVLSIHDKLSTLLMRGVHCMESVLRNVGNMIRDIRKSRGWSQEQLAEIAGTKHSDIGQIERGERNVTLRTLEKVAHTLGVEVYSLFEYEIQSKLAEKKYLITQIINILADMPENDLEKTLRILETIYRK